MLQIGLQIGAPIDVVIITIIQISLDLTGSHYVGGGANLQGGGQTYGIPLRALTLVYRISVTGRLARPSWRDHCVSQTSVNESIFWPAAGGIFLKIGPPQAEIF